MANEAVEGGCFCGSTRYLLSGEPISTGICHCRSCQRAAGAESVGWAVMPIAGFRWLTVAPKNFESSAGVTRTFCADCGTTLTYQNSPESIDVTLASLDDPEGLPPTAEVWLSDRISWNTTHEALPGFEEFSGRSKT